MGIAIETAECAISVDIVAGLKQLAQTATGSPPRGKCNLLSSKNWRKAFYLSGAVEMFGHHSPVPNYGTCSSVYASFFSLTSIRSAGTMYQPSLSLKAPAVKSQEPTKHTRSACALFSFVCFFFFVSFFSFFRPFFILFVQFSHGDGYFGDWYQV